MYRVEDVAEYVLAKLAPADGTVVCTPWQLQELVYYCQAWALVWDDSRLFEDRVEAWVDGPVVPELVRRHRGKYGIRAGDIEKNPRPIDDPDLRETIDMVVRDYGSMTALELWNLSHSERPWMEARGDLRPDQRGSQEDYLSNVYRCVGSAGGPAVAGPWYAYYFTY